MQDVAYKWPGSIRLICVISSSRIDAPSHSNSSKPNIWNSKLSAHDTFCLHSLLRHFLTHIESSKTDGFWWSYETKAKVRFFEFRVLPRILQIAVIFADQIHVDWMLHMGPWCTATLVSLERSVEKLSGQRATILPDARVYRKQIYANQCAFLNNCVSCFTSQLASGFRTSALQRREPSGMQWRHAHICLVKC